MFRWSTVTATGWIKKYVGDDLGGERVVKPAIERGEVRARRDSLLLGLREPEPCVLEQAKK